MGKKAKHQPKKKAEAVAKPKPKKPQGIIGSFSVKESDVDLAEFQKAFREGMEKANEKRVRGGVILPSYRRRKRRLIRTA